MKTNWQTKKLGEICQIKTGKKDVNQGNPNGKYPFFTCARDHTFSDEYSFDTEALLIAGNGDAGHVSYYNGKFEAYQRTYVLSDFKDILPKLLFIFLKGFLKDTVSKQKLGNTMPYIKMGMLSEFNVPIPPLPEQKRIVKILDEAFEKLEKAKQNAENNLQNSKELFESYSQDVFLNSNNNWKNKRLKEVCEYEKRPNKKANLPYVGLEDIESNSGRFKGVIVPKVVKSLTFHFSNEHVLYGRLRPYLNKVFLPNFEGHCSTEIFPIKPKKEMLEREYLFYWLKSNKTMKKINATWTGTTLPRANMNMVLDFKLAIPLINEQKSIVKKLDQLSEQTKKLESIYQNKLSAIEELKKSILNKAFSRGL